MYVWKFIKEWKEIYIYIYIYLSLFEYLKRKEWDLFECQRESSNWK